MRKEMFILLSIFNDHLRCPVLVAGDILPGLVLKELVV